VTRVLIVDDHPLYREGLASALRMHLPEIEVSGAASAEEGLEALERHPDVEAVLIDLRLPGMDGFGALAAYAARFPTVPRVLVSGQDGADLVRRAFDAGASGFIPKSMSVEAVAQAIRQVLGGGVFAPEPGAARAERAALTLRQLEVLRLLGEGYTNKEIARALDITERTAKAHVAAIFEALGADNRTQAVVAGQRMGLLPTTAASP
jgi:DNA-binding NarL/FixJ family response regulator